MDLGALGHGLWVHYHSNWVDVGTVLCALCWSLLRLVRLRRRVALTVIGYWAMDGMSIFPLALLSLSVFSRHIVEALLAASRPTLAIAGFFALMSVLTLDARGAGSL